MVSASVRYLFYQQMDEKIKTLTLRFPARENPDMEMALFDWPIVLQYDIKAKYRLISRKFSGMKFFHPSVRLTNQKPCALYPFDQPIKSLYFRSFVVSFCSRVFISRSYENRSIVAFRYSLLQSYSLSFTVYCSSFHSLLFLTVIPLVSIPFTVYFIPIFSILFTVYFQLNFIPFHFTVHCLVRPFPFRSLFS